MHCTADKNTALCTCTYGSCPRRGLCCQCVQYHRERDELPGCFFPPEVERTYDRSRAAFLEAYTKKTA